MHMTFSYGGPVRTLTKSRTAPSTTVPLALAATLLAAFAFLFAWPQSAAAHDSLVDSNPAADSTVDTLPAELTLTFSAALIPGEGSTEIVVTDAAGNDVAEGEPVLDGAMVTQPLAAEADAGEYRVLWKVVSSDGHPTDGEFGFTVTTSTIADDEPTPDPSATETMEQHTLPTPDFTKMPDGSTTDSGASFSPAWLIGGGIVVLIVVVLLILLLRPRKGTGSGSDTPAER